MDFVLPVLFTVLIVIAVLATARLHRKIIDDYREDIKERDHMIGQLINAKQFQQPLSNNQPVLQVSDDVKELQRTLQDVSMEDVQ